MQKLAEAINPSVALRKESVDRNILPVVPSRILRVALRKESVDRNLVAPVLETGGPWSLSARRAWIEIASNREKQKYPERRSPQGERG